MFLCKFVLVCVTGFRSKWCEHTRSYLACSLSGLMNSGASCLPVSSFPNANSYAQKRTGEKDEILTTMDYIKSGVPLLVICALLLLSLGFVLFEAY